MQILKGRHGRPRRAAAQARLDPVHAQRHRARPRHVPRPRRDARGLPGLRRDGLPRDAVRRRGRAAPALRPADRRDPRRDLEHVAIWPATHYNVTRRTIERARGRDRRASSTRAAPSSRARASCWSPTACASARSTTWRCCARWASARGSRTTRASSTAASRASGPYCLIDYFPDDFVCFIDESHQTVPQIGGMYEGDRSRKQTLVDYGFRLPERARQPPAEVRRVPVDHAADRVRLGHAGRVRAHALRARRRADRAARPASSTPRSRCARRGTRSTT